MALTVEKLNDDTTFLLALAPSFAPKKHARRCPGAFTILIDPWLVGQSSILHPKFQVSHHTSKSAVRSLADLAEQPDLIIISQDKPDHCHRETLCTLPADTQTKILATAAAAKKIRSWKHFHNGTVQVMTPFSSDKLHTVTRIRIPSYTSSSSKGEITIVNVPTKSDMTGLHNAIGITYTPPGSLLTGLNGTTVNLAELIRPDTSPSPLRKSKSAVKLTEAASRPATSGRPRTASSPRPVFLDPLGKGVPPMPSPPDMPNGHVRNDSKTSSNTLSSQHKEKTLSIIYTPHGLSLHTLDAYIDSHLLPMQALPLTCLFHSINVEQNPWFMGGLVANGAPGGLRIARELHVRHWISAHDEVKDNRGVATTWIKSRQYGPGEVKQMLREGVEGMSNDTAVHLLGVGENLRIDG